MLEPLNASPPPLGLIVTEWNRTLMCFGPTVSASPGGPSSADAAGGRVGPPRTNWTQLLGEFGAELGCPGPPGTTTSAPSRRRNATPYFMAWWQQLAWTAIFAVMVIVAVGGNSIVMWIVLAHRRMRTVTNYFLVNLSVADLLMAIFNCIFNFVYMLNSDWQFGRSYCTINNFVANVTVAASVFTLTGISIDRYLAIVRPLQPRMSKLSARITIVVIWVASATLGFPCLLYSTTITYKSSGQIRTACILVWPDGQPMVSTLDYVYNVVLFIVTYVLPMSAMAGCYTAMGRELWGSRSIGELTQRQIDSIRSKRKVVRMFIIIVLIFAVCWLPYHAYFIYTHHHSSVAYTKYVQHLYLAFYWLAMANCMVNPLIYYWMNARFRQYFKHAVCEWNCTWRRKQTPMDGAETPPMLGRYSHSYSRSRSADECSAHRNGGARNGNSGVASGGSAGGMAAGSGTGNNAPGSNVSRQVCACIELHAPTNRVMTTLRNVEANRSINDLSGSGSSPIAGTAAGSRRSHHHHHNHHRFHKRCRHNCSSNTTSIKRSNDTTVTTGATGASNKANNNGTVVNVTKETNYLQWRRNQYLFTFNEETNNDNIISSTSRNVVQGGKKETMVTSVDL